MLLAATLSTDPEAPALAQFEMRHLEDKYRNQVLTMACTLVSLVDLRDSYTGGHSTRVAEYSRRMVLELQLSDRDAEMVIMAGSLHDIGKIGVSEAILRKPGRLTDEEFEEIKKHPEFGWMVLRGVEGFEEISHAKLLETSDHTRGRDFIWCHPAYANRCAYVHNDKELICVSLAATNAPPKGG